jgi:hypothetical protein
MWLSAYAAARHAKPLATSSHPLAVVFVNRRILDFGGQRQNDAVAAVVANAAACGGLLQLDPLDAQDRSSYLCLALQVASLPQQVHAWVSGVANGNPQYTEICAKALEKADVLDLTLEPATPPPQPQLGDRAPQGGCEPLGTSRPTPLVVVARLKAGADLRAVPPPPKIAGFIRSTLSSLGPEERLLTQILALYPHATQQPNPDPSADPRLPPRPTAEVLRAGYECVAPMDSRRVGEVLQRLALYGILAEAPSQPTPSLPPSSSQPVAYALIWPLLKDLASAMLLKNQKEAILDRLGALSYAL